MEAEETRGPRGKKRVGDAYNVGAKITMSRELAKGEGKKNKVI
jgi:hypothetical protein